MLSVLVALVVLSFLVLIHEFGHFMVAKKQGLLVEEFGIGLPPRLIGKKIGETIYSINALPLGGFVRIFGEEGKSDESVENEYKSKKLEKRAFYAQKPWRRMLVLIAGIFMNFLLGFLIVWALFAKGTVMLLGDANRQYAHDIAVTVTGVQSGSPAEASGFKQGDAIEYMKAQGYDLYPKRIEDVQGFTKQFAGSDVTFQVKRDGQTVTLDATPRQNPPQGQGSLGIELGELGTIQYPFFQAGWQALVVSSDMSVQIFKLAGSSLAGIVFHGNLGAVSGPVGIVKYTSSAMQMGLDSFLSFIALISLNLAVFNFLPLPALDGGRIAFVLWEWITRKPVPQKYENWVHTIGMGLLILLLLLVTVGDIRKML